MEPCGHEVNSWEHDWMNCILDGNAVAERVTVETLLKVVAHLNYKIAISRRAALDAAYRR